MVQVRGFLLACPSPLPLGVAVLSTSVSCMQLSALLFFGNYPGYHSCGGKMTIVLLLLLLS